MVVGKWTRVRYLNHLVLIYFWRRQVDSTTWYLREMGFEDFPHIYILFLKCQTKLGGSQVGLRGVF